MLPGVRGISWKSPKQWHQGKVRTAPGLPGRLSSRLAREDRAALMFGVVSCRQRLLHKEKKLCFCSLLLRC